MGAAREHGRRRSAAWSAVAVVLLWAVLVAPYRPVDLGPSAWLRLPLEGLVLVGLLVVAPPRARRVLAAGAGLLLVALALLKLLDLGFRLALDRPFDPLSDAGYAGSAVSLLFDSTGTAGALGILTAAALVTAGALVALPWAALRVAAMVTRHRSPAARVVAALFGAWAVLTLSGASLGGGAVASTSAARLVLDERGRILSDLQDGRRFAAALSTDPLAGTPPRGTLSGLAGKDVLLVFVESYGRFALEGPGSGPVNAVLDRSTRRLRQAGFGARSAFLTSPTFGGVSWLAHSTLQSGLWVDSQARYDQLLASRRTSLMGLFREMGWRTVIDIPSSDRPWRQGRSFYRFRTMYGGSDVGYAGPPFGYARIPDQYTLQALEDRELASRHRRPLMAEVDLDSSHTPWAPLPHMVPWRDLGDGEVYGPMAAQGPSRAEVWSDTGRLRSAYAASVAYSLRALVGFVRRYGDDDLVLVVLGDHQPNSFVTGPGAGHDVPVSVIAHDPTVLRRIADWGWQPGLHPSPAAPVWRMDRFRGRFLHAYHGPSATRRPGYDAGSTAPAGPQPTSSR